MIDKVKTMISENRGRGKRSKRNTQFVKDYLRGTQ
jgi:hypothetical protein